MKNKFHLHGPVIQPTSGIIKNIILFLHGYGANGEDLINIGEHWKKTIPDTIFYSPNAPFICDINPLGYQWFPLIDRTKKELEEGLQTADPFIEEFTKNILKKHTLNFNNLFVVGFSQGTILSLYNFTKGKNQIGGIVGYSGLLYDNDNINQNEISFPILLYHGKDDEVINSNFTTEAEQILTTKGFTVNAVNREKLGHGIDQNGLKKGEEFIKNLL